MNYDLLKLRLKRLLASRAGFLALATLISFAAAAVALQEPSPPSSSSASKGEAKIEEEVGEDAIASEEVSSSIFDLPQKYREKLLAPLNRPKKKPTLQERLAQMERDRRDISPLSTNRSRTSSRELFNYRNLFSSRSAAQGTKTTSNGQTQEKTQEKLIQKPSSPAAVSTHSEEALLGKRNRSLSITPVDAIALALAAESEAKQTYLEWVARHRNSGGEEGNSARASSQRSGRHFRTSTIFELGNNLALKIPTSGENNNRGNIQMNAFAPEASRRKESLLGSTENLTQEQLSEEIQRLNSQKTVEDAVTNAIFAYRNLLVYQEKVKIEQRALTTAKAIVERDKSLIETGKLSQSERATGQEWVAYREARLNEANKAADGARAALLSLLQIDPNLQVLAVENLEINSPKIEGERLQQFMFERHPDYLLSQLAVQQAQLSFDKAESERQSSNFDRRSENLADNQKQEDKTLEVENESSGIDAIEARDRLVSLEETLNSRLNARLQDVVQSWDAIEAAKQARSVAEKNLEVELGQRALGQSELLTLVEWQNEGIQARNAELNAKVNYLNAIAKLDRAIGNTLNTWKIEL
ncbi:MAG: hypothetical protein SW833_03865 [Cyanobacteriota bacterium]|nr:hypothetical protein [Cyanobacteriota bacterium]